MLVDGRGPCYKSHCENKPSGKMNSSYLSPSINYQLSTHLLPQHLLRELLALRA